MLIPSKIKNHHFEAAGRNAYRAESVDEFFETVADSYEQMFKENGELVKKICLLAERIEEYRNEEDDIRNAFLGAQETAKGMIEAAEQKAESFIDDAQNKAKIVIDDAQQMAERIVDEANRNADILLTSILDDAHEKEKSIIDDAQRRAENLINEANRNADILLAEAEAKAERLEIEYIAKYSLY